MPKQFKTTLRLWWLAMWSGLLAMPAFASTSVTHYGITWTFSSDRPTGTFANGEPWVVGPVTVTNITPNPSQSVVGVQNGSMKNPVPGAKHGFDSNPVTMPSTSYDPALNVALSLPVTLAGGDNLVSAITVNSYPNFFDTVCVLTVVSSAPPAGSFRPAPYGKDHPVRWNKSQVNFSVLKNLAAVAGAPTKAQVEAKLPALPWWEWSSNYSGGLLSPWRNLAAGNGGDGKPSTYGREIAGKWGEVGLWLNLNNTEADKEKALIQTIQCGIDIWSYATNGGGFYHDGGHKCGRKFPVLVAAVALNDPTLLAFVKSPNIFQEDTQTFIVTQSDVGRSVVSPKVTYDKSHVGMAEWGVRHRWEPEQDDSRWGVEGTPYRHVNWPNMAGPVLAAELMGRKNEWGHPAIFAFAERYATLSGLTGFTKNMWTTHKTGSGTPPIIITPLPNPVIQPSSGYFETAQTVTMTTSTSGASIYYTLDGSAPSNSSTLYNGPFTVSSTKTIKAITYDAAATNTSAVVTTQLTFSSSPPTFSPSPGGYSTAQNVTLSTTTANAVIRYTTDGNEPTAASPVFSTPIPVSATTTLKAAAFKSGLDASPTSTGVYAIGQLVGSPDWISVGINPPRTEAFVYEYDATPSSGGIDAVVGLAGINPVVDYTNLACAVRFNTSGKIDVRNGSAYQALVDYPYAAGTTYRVRISVYPKTKTYDVKVSANGGSFVELAKGSAFRSEQASLGTISCMGLAAPTGSHSVSNFGVVADRPAQVQGVNSANP